MKILKKAPILFTFLVIPTMKNNKMCKQGIPQIIKWMKTMGMLKLLPFHSHLHWSEWTHSCCETRQRADPSCPSHSPQSSANLKHLKPTKPTLPNRKSQLGNTPPVHLKDPTLRSTTLGSAPITRNPNSAYSKSPEREREEKSLILIPQQAKCAL